MTTLVVAVLVLAGGAVGAVTRYVLDGYVKSVAGKSLPWGTFSVNMLGTAVLGGFHGAASGTYVEALMGTGLAGALTTFSTFELDTVHLFQDGKYGRAAVNVLGTLLLGFGVFIAFHAFLRELT
ncbi:fluoride efflux transporter FluC [Actinomadura livida]|uniref:Fluoride-specific ion channel FluC n=1 Tax=Actinomadura livida TaxID=79909 RepID=A0A7W7IKU8_9ACTN|nr:MULTISPECIES: CrcB family protein [Actinomadura]MBB4778548.1 CrcB protein [Actinomadura catellatispora]GGU38138.1 putative fluoride ion transporter CrcB 2 [Actinomadura livida]